MKGSLATPLSTLCALLLCTGAQAAQPVATTISAAHEHTCSSMSSGEVDCWGIDYVVHRHGHVPVPVPGLRRVIAVSANERYTCALLARRTIECWGDDGYGQLGNGLRKDTDSPVEVAGIRNAVAISTGGYHACALLATGAIDCWGRNLRGALGDGSLRNSSVPVRVSGIKDATAVSAGFREDETCAVLSTGRVECWGANRRGQLGNGTRVDSSVPVAVKGISNATSVSAAGAHACAVLATGAIDCWGANRAGALGNGSTKDSSTPVRVQGITDAAGVAAGARGWSCAVLHSGAVFCWGENQDNELGNGRWPVGSTVPVRALGITNATSITAGAADACSLLSSGGAKCWGFRGYGQLGRRGVPAFSNPVAVEFPAAPEPTKQ